MFPKAPHLKVPTITGLITKGKKTVRLRIFVESTASPIGAAEVVIMDEFEEEGSKH
jgi:hypothetical protein